MALTLAVIAEFGGELTVSVDSLHSTLKAVMRPLDTKYKKATF